MNVALKIKEIADKADLIVNGYAYTRDKDYIRIINLNNLNHTAAIYNDKIVETNMDEIEVQIVLDYYIQDKEFLDSSET
jgi:hypothetical protein